MVSKKAIGIGITALALIAYSTTRIFNPSKPKKPTTLEALLKQDNTSEKFETSKEVLELEAKLNAKKKEIGYITEFHEIKQDVNQGEYGDVSQRIKTLAAKLEQDGYLKGSSLLNKVKEFNYIKQVHVPARTERKVVKKGYHEQVWVPPEYKTEKKFNTSRTVGNLALFVVTFGNAGFNGKGGAWDCEKVKVKDGYYKEGKWHPPVQGDVTVPAHYKKIEVNPFKGTEKPVS